jgi:hypothetical protein
MNRSKLALVCVAAAVLCASCSGPERSDAGDTVVSFEDAVRAQDGSAACRALAPSVVESLEEEGEPCAEAVLAGALGEELTERAADAVDVADVATAGVQAQVRTPGDVLFLTVSGDRWLITAAACDARPHRPYDCRLEGQ